MTFLVILYNKVMYLLFDIGGTNTRLSYTEDLQTFLKPAIFPTPKTFEEGINLIEEIFKDFAQGHNINAIAGGIAGPLNKQKTKLINAPHLKTWIDKPLKLVLERVFDAPVFLENDTALAALGEATRGAGKGHGIVTYITISTGVGGARIVNEKIDISSQGFEPGHQIISISDHMFSKDCNGSLEDYISGSALELRYKKRPIEITDEKIWDKNMKMLAYGLHNTILHWSPDVVVLGGAVMKSMDIPTIGRYVRETMEIFRDTPGIEAATLGTHGGIYGAMELLKQHGLE